MFVGGYFERINDMVPLLCPIRFRQVILYKESVYSKIQEKIRKNKFIKKKKKIVYKYMIKNNKNLEWTKHNRNSCQQISGKERATNYQFQYRGTSSMGQPYRGLFSFEQIPQFVTELKQLLYNIDVLFVVP